MESAKCIKNYITLHLISYLKIPILLYLKSSKKKVKFNVSIKLFEDFLYF